MTLIIQNADKRLLKIINALNIDNKMPYKIKKQENLKAWKKESKDTIKAYKAGKLKTYKSVDSMIKAIESEK